MLYCIEYMKCNQCGLTYLYVGSHKCNPLDDGYVGSAGGFRGTRNPAPWRSWKIKAITDITAEFVTEHDAIEYYASAYGAAQVVQCHCEKCNVWVNKYVRSDGRLLNAHSNDLTNAACKSRTPEARAKAVAHTDYHDVMKKVYTPESRAKAVAHTDYHAIAEKRDWKKFNELGNSPESRAKAVAHTDYHAIAEYNRTHIDYASRDIDYVASRKAGVRTFIENLPKYRLADGFVGNYKEVAVHIHYEGKYATDVARWLQRKRKPARKYVDYFENFEQVS